MKRNQLITAGLFLLSLTGILGLGHFSWKAMVWLVQSLTHAWWLWLLVFTFAGGAVRRWGFQRPALWGRALLLNFVLYTLVFHGIFWPTSAQPTLLILWPFWHLLWALDLLVLDWLKQKHEALNTQAQPRPWLYVPVITVLLGAYWVLLSPAAHAVIETAPSAVLFWSVILLPLLSGRLRQTLYQKNSSYLVGVFINYIVFQLLAVFNPLEAQTWNIIDLSGVYAALWLHVFYEYPWAWLQWLADLKAWRERFRRVAEWFKHLTAHAAPEPTSKWGKFFSGRALVGFVSQHRKILSLSLLAIVLVAVLIPVTKKVYRNFFVDILEFTPQGEVYERTSLRLTFSDAVKVTGDIEQMDCLTITPTLPGSYRLVTDKTLMFIPSEPLKPSTQYTAIFAPGKKLSGVKKRLIATAKTRFYTPRFRVTGSNLFYNVDSITGEEMGVVAQLDFNHPVQATDLRKCTELLLNGKTAPFEIEKSVSNTRYYLKIAGIKPQEKDQSVSLTVSKKLNCINGTDGLERDFQKELALPAKPKLEVSEVKLWHEPGTTLVSILFNLPISQAEVKRCVRLDPEVPFTVETEYAYAVLRGHFKPNVNYTVKINQGLKARTGQALEESREQEICITDLPPQVKFAREGNVLSLNGPKTLEIKTINLDQVRVTIQKAYRNNLVEFLDNPEYPPRMRSIYEGTYDVEEGQINEEVSQYVNLSKFQNEPYKGMFKIDLTDPQTYENKASAWFLCTDLGLVAKQSGDDLLVYVLSIDTHVPRGGVAVELYSTDNQVMDKQITDGSGRATFTQWRNHAYKLYPRFLVAKSEDDFSFLEFSRSELNQYQFSIGGDPHDRKNLEAFLTPERGVYRPGETVHLTAIIRNADNSLPPQLPLRLEVRDPRNSLLKQMTVRANENGLATVDLPIPGDALTGQYTARMRTLEKEEPAGTTTFKIEEFIPDKIKVEVKTPKTPLAAGAPLKFSVFARQMFGPPAAKSKVVTSVRFYSRLFAHANYPDYTFADESASFQDQELDLGQDQLDTAGTKEYSVALPLMTPPSALKAYIYSEVYDSGGRPVSAAGYVDINPYSHYLGVALENKAPYLTKTAVKLKLAAISPEGKPLTLSKVRLVIKRKAWYSIFRSSDWGRSGYQSASYEELITNKEIDIKGKGSYTFTPDLEGEYKVLLISPEGMRSSLNINVVGSGYDVASLESPEKLKIVLDQKAYAVGDEAKVFVRAPFPGKLFLTLEREKVYETRIVDMPGRETTVSFPITTDHLPNVYVVGLLVRKPDAALKTLPMTSFGVEPLTVKTEAKRLGLNWTIASSVKSADGIDVVLDVPNANERTNVVLAAVDEGILQITGFATPNPLEYFYRKRSLTTLSYTILNLLLPDVLAKKFAIGGGDLGEFTRRHLNPVQAKKKKSLALFSGILRPDADGKIRYHFNTRGFNGEVRVMALGASGDRYGSSAKSVTVADPIVLIPNFPRFLAPQDTFQIPVEVYNKLGRDAQITVRLTATDPVTLTGVPAVQTFSLQKEEQKKLIFQGEVKNNAGVAKLRVSAQAGTYEIAQEEEVSVRPFTTLRSTVKHGTVKPGNAITLKVPGGFIPFGQRLRLNTSGNPMFQYLGVLDALITYPYGCGEQVTSQAFPLLYYKDLGFATGRFAQRANAVDEYVQAAILKLEKLQLEDGEFALWPGGTSGGHWLDTYIAHFLLEAQRKGYTVDAAVMKKVKAFVTAGKTVAEEKHPSRLDRRNQNEDRAPIEPYMLYLKALMGEPDKEGMSFILTKQLATLQEADRALLSLTYSEIGDKETAEKILTPDFKSRFLYREQYGSFNSSVRNTAMYLAALAQANPASPRIQPLIAYLTEQLENGQLGNTQENAWMLMALSRVYTQEAPPVKTEILANGQPYKTLEGTDLNVEDTGLTGKTLTLKNTGAAPSFYFLMTEGTPLAKSTKSTSHGLNIERSFRDASGKELNLTNVPQGSLAVVTLTISATKETVRNVVVVDVLPSGFEIENPRLASRGQLGFDPNITLSPQYQDIREDRLLVFCDAIEGSQTFSYTVRAVTPGRFVIPNAFAEALYDPAIKAEYYEPKALVVVENNGQ